MPRLWIVRDYEKCCGCRLCEIACSLAHEGVVWPEASRVRVLETKPGVSIPVLCLQCKDPPCVEACPTNALRVDEYTGAVVVSEECVLCGKCIEACPAKIPRIIDGVDKVVICDLCGGDPACVKICNEAGFGALRVTRRPRSSVMNLYVMDPFKLAELVEKKLYGE